MREPVNPTDIGVKSDEEILREAVEAHKPHREGKHVFIYHAGRKIFLHPLTVGDMRKAWGDAVDGAYVAAMQELEPEMTVRKGLDG